MSINVLYDDILHIIAEYSSKYKLVDWIDEKWLNFSHLSSNPNAIKMLLDNPEKIDWKNLSENPTPQAIKLLEDNPSKIDYELLCCNTGIDAVKLIDKYINEIENANVAGSLYDNLNTFHIVERYIKELGIDRINWYSFSRNPNPKAIEIMKQNIDKVDWDMIALNSGAIDIIENNLAEFNWDEFSDKYIDFEACPYQIPGCVCDYCDITYDKIRFISDRIRMLSHNQHPRALALVEENLEFFDEWDLISKNPSAVYLLEKYPDDIFFSELSENKNATHLIKQHMDNMDIEEKIDYVKKSHLSKNPSIFELNTDTVYNSIIYSIKKKNKKKKKNIKNKKKNKKKKKKKKNFNNRMKNEQKYYESLSTFKDICNYGADFCKNKYKYFPGYFITENTINLREANTNNNLKYYLTEFNKLGFFTMCSQPCEYSILPAESQDYFQRSFVSGYLTIEQGERMIKHFKNDNSIVKHRTIVSFKGTIEQSKYIQKLDKELDNEKYVIKYLNNDKNTGYTRSGFNIKYEPENMEFFDEYFENIEENDNIVMVNIASKLFDDVNNIFWEKILTFLRKNQ